MKLDDAPRELTRALRRLDPAQGIVGRRNARRAVLTALSGARRALDREFPAIKRRSLPKSNDLNARIRRWEARGYVNDLLVHTHAIDYARARIPIRTFGQSINLVPNWALLVVRSADYPSSQLAQLRNSSRARKLFLAEQALKRLKLP